MVIAPKDVFKRTIVVTDEDFDIEKIYKNFKKRAESMGYYFVEKEQGVKGAKYGQEVGFKFSLSRKIDVFAKSQYELEFVFDNLKKIDGFDHGNCRIKIVGSAILDYENKWGKSTFDLILLKLYLKVIGAEIKRKYFGAVVKDGFEINDSIKSDFGFYT